MAKQVKRTSSKRINSFLRETTGYLKREDKLAIKIAGEENEIKELTDKGASPYLVKIHEYKVSKLKAELNRVNSNRVKVERKFGGAIDKNNSLNKNDDSSSSEE